MPNEPYTPETLRQAHLLNVIDLVDRDPGIDANQRTSARRKWIDYPERTQWTQRF